MMEDCEEVFVRQATWNPDFEDVLLRARNFHRSVGIEERRFPLATRDVDVDVEDVGASLALAPSQRRLDQDGVELAVAGDIQNDVDL